MAADANLFSLQDVIDGVTEKLTRRHPHVFGSRKVSGSDEVIKNWEAIKLEEKRNGRMFLMEFLRDCRR